MPSEASRSQKDRYRATPRTGGPGRSRGHSDRGGGEGGAALGEGSECQGRWNVLQTGWRRLQDPASVLSAAESRRPTRRARVVDFITAGSRARDCERGVRAS